MTAPITARDHELTCHEVIQLVTDYLEGALSETDRQRFEDHISGCDGCDGYVAQMRATVRLTGRLTPEAVSPEARERLVEAFRDWESASPPPDQERSLRAKLGKFFKR